LKGLLKDTRKLFSHYNFLFTLVQLAGYERGEFRPIRQVMEDSLKDLPKSGMATAIDLGEMQDIHPRKKDELGRRIQLITSALEYNQTDVEFQGPKLKSVGQERNGNVVKFKLDFEIFGGRSNGLVLQESTFCSTCCKSTKTIFMVTTSNSKFYHPESISIDVNSVEFSVQIPSNEKVSEVRYAWEKYSQCVVASKDFKLPITPFIKKLSF
jgi:sialate O-acetylesterase